MKAAEGLAGLAAREAANHPAPATGELERLRAEVSLLQQEARVRKSLCEGLADEVAAERAAVVAWLRHKAAAWGTEGSMSYAADLIEDGEHRREEES